MRSLRLALCLLGAAAAAGCVSGRPHLENLAELQSGEIVLVGRVELVPPLNDKEQELNTLTSDRFRGKGHAIIGEEVFDLDDLPISAGSQSVEFEFGREFYVRQPRASALVYSGSVVLMKSTQTGRRSVEVGQLRLPGRLKFKIASGDRAVYIGTIRYHRDEYNGITKVELIDDSARVRREFAKKYGTRLALTRLAPQRVK